MSRHFLMVVHLHADGMGTARFHGMLQGAPEWPPAPGRVFQALVAAAARGQQMPPERQQALQWLERQTAPVIAAPVRTVGEPVSMYVPNNDADSLPDPSEVSGIRTAKQVQPSLFCGDDPLLYAWALPDGDAPTDVLTDIAHGVYQLGRGVDMAWARAEVVGTDELERTLRHHRGIVYEPVTAGTAAPVLPCPAAGSLDSLVTRHQAPRLRTEGAGRKSRTLFTNAPKPRFASVSYASRRHQVLYELRERGTARAWPWPIHAAVALVEQVRDAAARRLQQALPEQAEAIARCLIGRAADGATDVPLAQRVRILPLPSIGAEHADHAIRRVLIDVPSGCPVLTNDLDWAFSGLDAVHPDTGEASAWMLVRAEDSGMLQHYRRSTPHWQSVTPLALPMTAARRRLDPERDRSEDKTAAERQQEERQAVAAVHRALRHAGIRATAVQVQVRREPFAPQGRRAEAHADGTRFAKERLWHVSLSFDRPIGGPFSLGDGRFLGLGVMAPAWTATGQRHDPAAWTGQDSDGILAFKVDDPGSADQDPVQMARAFRRAVMARVADTLKGSDRGALSAFFSGHSEGESAPDDQPGRHLAFHWDAPQRRWWVFAPHRVDHRTVTFAEVKQWQQLQRAMVNLVEVLAGGFGRYAVHAQPVDQDDPVLGAACVWESVTPYQVTRHRRCASAAEASVSDVLADCGRRNLPAPQVEVLAVEAVRGQGLQGRLRLTFRSAVAGPLALGRTGLLGGGLFSRIG
jgi:CRISPR-associated protein Csb2